ncbi:MAG: GNAT family N-acetyltransferase [Janthinobacterium lividum]
MASTSDPTIIIRPAHEDDLSALTEIYNAAVTSTAFTGHFAPQTINERRSWWHSHQDPRYPILVADTGRDLLGYASLSQWYDTPVYAHTAESSLYLALGAQGRGLGTTLMRTLLDTARHLGHHVILARIWSENAPSIAMCRKCGYEIIGVQREVGFRNNIWENCVEMQVIL